MKIKKKNIASLCSIGGILSTSIISITSCSEGIPILNNIGEKNVLQVGNPDGYIEYSVSNPSHILPRVCIEDSDKEEFVKAITYFVWNSDYTILTIHMVEKNNEFILNPSLPQVIPVAFHLSINGVNSNTQLFCFNKWEVEYNEYSWYSEDTLEHMQFLYDRTYSIFSMVDVESWNGYIGTTWLLGKYCTWNGEDWVFDEQNPYHYYFGTNLHVAADIYEAYDVNIPYTNNSAILLGASESLPLNETYYDWIYDDQYAYYNFVNCIGLNKEYFATCSESEQLESNERVTCDFAVFDINFPKVWLTNNPSQKEKLDRINEFCESQGGETQMSFKLANREAKFLETTYALGYPSCNLTPDSMTSSRLARKKSFVSLSEDYFTNKEIVIDSPVYIDNQGVSYYDTGYVYYSGPYSGMKGGSSGSLVINDNYEALAINFAGPSADEYYSYYGSLYNVYESFFKDGDDGYDLFNGDYAKNKGGFYSYLKYIS